MEPKASLNENRNGLAPIVRWSSMASSVDSSVGVSPAKSLTSSGIVPDTASNRPSEDGSNVEEPQLFPSTSTAMSTGSDDDRQNNNRLHRRKKSPDESDADAATVLTVPNNDEGVKFDLPDDDSIMSSSSSLCGNRKTLKKPEPNIPDGGWGWMVVLSSFFISMIADGISFSFGLLYIRFLKHFGATKSATSWIGSLFMAVPLLSGPIGSALVDRYGCRWMTIVGGIISGIGFLLSSLCDSILMMYLTFGVIAGLGLGLGYVTAVVSIAPWFDKRRVLATGLGACGTGVGTVVYAPMTQYFIDEYGWRGTVIMLAGTFFNMCVCGALMRDPEWWVQEQQQQQLQKSNRGSSCTSLVTTADLQALEEVRLMLKAGESPDYILTQLATSIKAPENEQRAAEGPVQHISPNNVQSVYNLPTFLRQNEKVPLEVLEALRSNKRMYHVIVENYPSLLSCRSMSDNKLNKMAAEVPTSRVPVTMRISSAQNKVKPVMEPHMEPLLPPATLPEIKMKSVSPPKDFVFKKKQSIMDNQHYFKNIKVHRNSIMYRGATLNTRNYRLKASSCPDIYRNSMTTLAKETEENWFSELIELLKGLCDFSLFLELHFMLMSWGTILLFTWFVVPYFYLAEFMTRHNYTENDGSFALSVIGFTNFVGMVALGWLGDRPWVDVATAYAICLTLFGLFTCAIPLFMDNYPLLILSRAMFGLTFASNFSFTPPVTVKLTSLERFTSAYGLILLCQGIGHLVGPPLGGAVFDLTGSWDLAFYLAGIQIIISGLMIGLIPMTKNRMLQRITFVFYDRFENFAVRLRLQTISEIAFPSLILFETIIMAVASCDFKVLSVVVVVVFVLGPFCNCNNAEFPSDQEANIIRRLYSDVTPSSYIIRMNSSLYPVFISNGEVIIDLTVKSAVENITLHARKLDVISVMILEKHRFKKYKIDRSDPSNVLDIVRKAGDIKSFSLDNDLLAIPARGAGEVNTGYFKPGDYLLYARFNAMIGDLAQGYGLYRDSYEDGNRTSWLMSTVFETSRARTAFPCFDEPSFKARFKIILSRTTEQVALANMPSVKSYPMDGTDLMWEEFEETPPMPTYLVAFFVGDFTPYTGRRGGGLTVWTAPLHERARVEWSLEEGYRALYHMQNVFDLDDPLPKTDLLAMPHFDVAGAVENWGLITMREDILTLSNKTGQALRRRMTILAHELAHTFFGNSVTPSWWDEVWWSEGFASYYATRIVQKLRPDWDVISWDSVDFLSETWKLDSKPEVRYLAKPVEAHDELNFGNLVYCKGFLVARFASWITQRAATFDKAVGKYLKENQFGLFNDRKMWRTIEEAVVAKNNSIMDLPAPLAIIMRSWTHQAGMPLIKVLRTSSGLITITQERYTEKMKTGNETKSRKLSGEKWWIPIEIEFGDRSSANLVIENSSQSNESQYSRKRQAPLPTLEKQIHWMNPVDEKLEIKDLDEDHSSWVLINLNVPVPCRIMYDEWNLQMLTRNDYKRFTTVGLAQIIADVSALAMNGEYRLPLAMQVIRDVLQATDSFAVWRIGLVNLHKIEYQLKGTGAHQLYQQFIQQMIGGQFDRLKILSDSREKEMTMNDELLRFEVAETACNVRLRACLIEANNIFRKWIDNSTKSESQNFIRHDVRTTVYCTAVELGGEREWLFLWDQLQGKRSHIDQEERRRILDALACSKNQQLLKRYLESSLQTNSTDHLRNFKERRAVFNSVLKNVDAVDLLMDFMQVNKEDMKRAYSKSEKRFSWKRAVTMLASFISTNHITKLEKLTKNSQILNKARKVIKWRSENSQEVAEWLKRAVV
ncbi:hypothetical protein LSTR_LSTR009863 [Laodelphax striatellus]|uniref:Major facilitator superfamily (MFS) profile domain-containing protein n=1 Tax=Laodelphax striatellus TaxID=195883 RepID=A0A482WGY2_LAOST|nr:hypothetical protein LSTR_LSTR009863 [Laodelphax striatellus]